MRRVLGAAVLAACAALNASAPPPWSDSASSVRLGEKLLHGDLAGFTGIGRLVHTPHPGPILAATPLGLLGHHGALVAFGILSGVAFAGLVFAAFRLGSLLANRAAGLLAAAMVGLPPHVVSAARDTADVPFAAFVVTAALMAIQGRARATLLALTAAGCLRPEAWVLAAGCAFVWRARLRWDLALPLAAPLVWALFGLVTTGDPLVALHTTRAYNTGDSIGLANLQLMSGMVSTPVLMAGVIGALVAVRARDRRRMLVIGFAAVLAAATFAECIVGHLVFFGRFLLPSAALLAVLGAVAAIDWLSRFGAPQRLLDGSWLSPGDPAELSNPAARMPCIEG